MKLNSLALGLTLGILWGAAVLLVTLKISIFGGGETLKALNKLYAGFSVSYVGAFIGLIWGFVHGFVSGWLVGVIYNALARKKQ